MIPLDLPVDQPLETVVYRQHRVPIVQREAGRGAHSRVHAWRRRADGEHLAPPALPGAGCGAPGCVARTHASKTGTAKASARVDTVITRADGTLVAGFCIAYLFTIVSPTPSGIGVVEGALAIGLSSMGVPLSAATVVTVAYRGLTFWLPFLYGFVGIRVLEHRWAQHRAEPPQ